MAKQIITLEQGAELKRLYTEHALAVAHASEMLRNHGTESPDFLMADKAAGRAWTRIREILGISHWME